MIKVLTGSVCLVRLLSWLAGGHHLAMSSHLPPFYGLTWCFLCVRKGDSEVSSFYKHTSPLVLEPYAYYLLT